ncbi:hypothetical protein BsWGS_25731 [Bradybaena similaris]
MDTGDPPHEDAPKATTTGGGKGKKKKKEGKKTLTLDQFLAQDDGYSEPKSTNWAILSENPDDEFDAPVMKFDRSMLPTAPKAALGPKVDLSQIPTNGPFSAYVGNIPYDAKESDLMQFFSKLDVDTVRLIYDGGRPKGYAYVDFKNRDSLLEALTYHEKDYMGRAIRVDLATEKNQDTRGGPRGNEPDRTEGDWRRSKPASDGGSSFRDSDRGGRYGDRGFSDRGSGGPERDRGSGGGFSDRSDRGFGDRDRDRGGFGDRDRDRGGFGDRDRDRGSFGGDRDRDRGFGGDRDRGFGGDRDRGFSDRDRGGFSDRDRGFGGDRDRGFGGDRDRDKSFGGDRDRGFGGERSSRGYGFNRDSRDRDEGGRFGGSRGGGGGGSGFEDRYSGRRDDERRDDRRDDFNRGRREDNFERKQPSRDGSQEHRDGPKERPVLNLKPRTKPVENKENQPSSRSSIFGSAKPVDTYAREKEIEEKLKKKDDGEHSQPLSRRRDSESSDHGWRSGEKHGEARRESGDGSGRVSRRDSDHSHVSDDGSSEDGSRVGGSKSAESGPKMVPAPPPKENAWSRKKESGTASSSSSSSSNVSNNATVSSPVSAALPDKKEGQPPKPSAGSAGRGWGPQTKADAAPGKRPPADKVTSSSQNGPPARKSDNPKNRPPKDKAVPKHFEEMPKYEDTKAKDFSDQNKFAFLLDDENEGDAQGSGDEEAPATS